ncbi:MAG: secretion protein Por, partial [Paludibacteraceae bacterium]|nr:secretion protein Por [Paludibacteraceae bacterium]
MRKKLFFVVVLLFSMANIFAVCKHDNYIGDNDVAGWMWQYYSSWQPGSAPAGTKNENFFIGRVRPLKRFTNENTQVIQDSKTSMRRQRKVLWWCPINEGAWTSLPRYAFDSEAFSSWSYIDIHGNWTQGLMRQPGAFADVAHKNGVATSVVSAAPWAVAQTNYDGGHGQNYKALVDGGADKLMKLLKYYGIDGMGFNSEQTWESFNGMKTLLFNCHALRETYDMPLLHFDFYNLSSSLSSGSCGSTSFDCFFPAANGFFLNYNWSSLAGVVSTANTMIANAGGNFSQYVSSYDVYGGMDMQGRSSAGWSYIDQAAASVGIWGAHNKCMPYEGATEDGSTPMAIQKCYLKKCEYLFTGGTRNPVNDLTISSKLCSGTPDFFGISKLVAAKSSLSWKANDYFPFMTYFNLGNGQFFKSEGVTTYNDEWYNIGVQDFLPTWRWWITTSWMGRTTSVVPSGFNAEFTYEDAWFGGSCLKVENTNAANTSVYLHLFKTQFPLATGYEFTIRYKVLSGKATVQLVGSKEGSEGTAVAR